MSRRSALARLSPCLAMTLFACAPSAESDDGRELGTAEDPIVAERPGQVEYAFRYYRNPFIARTQFASPEYAGGCSATMIGPNIVMTAAHCGGNTTGVPVRFTTYRNDETERNSETFQCKTLVQGWPAHDLRLAFCEPNAAGVNPGDKYGYLDLETRAPLVNDPVYSIWWNPVTSGLTGTSMVPLYSAGRVVSTNRTFWGLTEFAEGLAGKPVGIEMSTWARSGASGSASVSATTHRILVGPTTLATSLPDGSASKQAWSMRSYLGASLVPTQNTVSWGRVEQIFPASFPPGSYSFGSYVGRVDKDGGGIFDVQSDVEVQRGENPRATFALGFESRRRNGLWNVLGATLDEAKAEMRVSSTSPIWLATHDRLRLKPNTTYRIGMRVRTTSAGSASALRVGFERWIPGYSSQVDLATPAGTTVYRTALIRTDASPAPLVIRTTAAFSGAVSEIVLHEDAATTTFDLADQRVGWNRISGPAHFLPQGVTAGAGGAPDFALAIIPASHGEHAAYTQALAFVTTRTQQLCFKVRSSAPTSGVGTAFVDSGGAVALNVTFPLSTTWTSRCFSGIRTPSSDTTLALSSASAGSAVVFFDDVRVEDAPAFFDPILVKGL